MSSDDLDTAYVSVVVTCVLYASLALIVGAAHGWRWRIEEGQDRLGVCVCVCVYLHVMRQDTLAGQPTNQPTNQLTDNKPTNDKLIMQNPLMQNPPSFYLLTPLPCMCDVC